MTISELIYQVKVRMEELTPMGEGLAVLDPSGGDPVPVTSGLVVLRPERYEKPIETYILQCIEEAWILLASFCPVNYLTSKPLTDVELHPDQDGSGHFTLPDDFYSLRSLKLAGWERPVINTIREDTPQYRAQFNEYSRGGISKPIAAVVTRNGKKVLEYFSLPKYMPEHKLEYGYYIPRLALSKDMNGHIDIHQELDMDNELIYPLIYCIASKVYLIYKQYDVAQAMIQTAQQHIQTIEK